MDSVTTLPSRNNICKHRNTHKLDIMAEEAQQGKNAWDEITSSLNPLHHQTVDEVETKWFSVLSKSRKKISAIRKEYKVK